MITSSRESVHWSDSLELDCGVCLTRRYPYHFGYIQVNHEKRVRDDEIGIIKGGGLGWMRVVSAS